MQAARPDEGETSRVESTSRKLRGRAMDAEAESLEKNIE
jgi:hypothetical protein